MGNAHGAVPNVAVEQVRFSGRLRQSCYGMCFGAVLFIAALALLGWNEFNFVRNDKVIALVAENVTTISCTPDPANVGKLVYASCPLTALHDFQADGRVQAKLLPGFESGLNGAWFEATSQIYQWREQKDCKEEKTVGGGLRRECTYSYRQEWAPNPVDSNSFYCISGFRPGCIDHYGSDIRNRGHIPSALQQKVYAEDGAVRMGEAEADSDFGLNSGMLVAFSGRPLRLAPLTAAATSSVLPGLQVLDMGAGNAQFQAQVGVLTIGDVRTAFRLSAVELGKTSVSVVAEQGGRRHQLLPYDTGLPGTMSVANWAREGRLSLERMIELAQQDNTLLTRFLRLLGVVLVFAGLQLVTRPVSLMPEVVPLVGGMLGGLVGYALCAFNFVIATAISLLVISVSWLLARPMKSLAFFLVAGLLFSMAAYLRPRLAKLQNSAGRLESSLAFASHYR